MESTRERSDFREAAKTLKGSRDVGAQLFCALLRSVGVEARLVCSLQPLSCVAGAPTMPKQRNTQAPQSQPSKGELYAAAVAKHETKFPDFQAGATTPSPRSRLGHPHAAAYHIPSMAVTSQSPPKIVSETPPKIRGESPFPVYWVEVLDVAHQKWHPVDPLVTCTQWKPRALEPPASDRDNCMTYVVAFEADGSARDVTRRYAKAYNAKTRKMRIDGAVSAASPTPPPTSGTPPTPLLSGERWWRRALRRYARPFPTDLDQIEQSELAAEEAREPMPRNVADFKDHPVYALERHLRRHEVLVPGARPIGTVAPGSGGSKGAPPPPLERIYRRSDVRLARTRERWYRLGRVVKPGEEPVKVLPKRQRTKRSGLSDREEGTDDDDDDPDRVGLFGELAGTSADSTLLYTAEQTEPYAPAPVVGGRVPRNRFGNVELFVPSMLPPGGAHVAHERAAQAARLAGVDYAPALTGFEFRGRRGTAVLRGVVVPREAADAVWAVVEGLEALQAEEESERRARRALAMWSRFLKALRIRRRIWAGVDEAAKAERAGGEEKKEEEGEGEGEGVGDVGMEDVASDDGMGGGGGGFFVPDEDDDDDDDDDDDGGGGFLVE